jgi:hypothetical protein
LVALSGIQHQLIRGFQSNHRVPPLHVIHRPNTTLDNFRQCR